MTPGPVQHRLSDWLDLHELTPDMCRRLLDAMPEGAAPLVQDEDPGSMAGVAIDLESAWRMVVAAMRAFFPAQRGLIDLTFEKSEKMLVPRRAGSRKAATIDNGPETYPTILYSYGGEAADLLVLAHEFSHALQLRASGGWFVSPVMREICAFVGEHALLCLVASLDAGHYRALCQRRDTDSARYFGAGKQGLLAALVQSDPPYRYAWNYPIARYLAIESLNRLTPDGLWALFEGRRTVAALLRELALP